MRKAFNFYKSYFDVYKELESNEDKIAFIEALLNRQFNGTEPEDLNGMAKFAYISQKEVIDKQIKGWLDKTGCTFSPPSVGGSATPSVQEKEKEQGEEQVQEKEEVQHYNTGKIDINGNRI